MFRDAEEMRSMASDSQLEIADFKEKYSGFYESSRVTLEKISYAQSINFASLVKLDHLVFKQNGYMALNNGVDSEEAKAVLVDHHNCRLGKWYDAGEGREKFGHTASFDKLETPHAGVHNAIHQAIEYIGQDWEKNVKVKDKIVEAFESAEASSDRVMGIIDDMVEEHQRSVLS